jgi:hypothetical protein
MGLFKYLHAHLQVVYYNCVKFHKNSISSLVGVALTRYMPPQVQHERRYGKPKVSYNKYLIFEIYGKSFRMEKNYKLMVSFQSHLWFLKV